MSSEYFVEHSSAYVSRRDLSSKERSTGNKRWFPRSSTKWNESIGNELMCFFTKCNYPYRMIETIPFTEPIRSEIRRFFISLDAYIESPNPVIPEKIILYGNCQKDFADYLKKVKRKSFQTSWHTENFSKPDWWDDIPFYYIKEIGDIFNYAYCIFWEGDVDDYEWGFLDVKINKDTMEEFKETLRELLPRRNMVEKIDKTEILLDISSSSSLDGDVHRPHWKVKPDRLYFNKERTVCDRCVIQVSPNNYRDAHILDPADINTIGWIDKQTMMILREMKEHIHLVDKDEATRRCRHLYNNYTHFLQRDFRKEGITKPHEMACAIIEVLQEFYPDLEAYQGMENFYSSFPLRINGEVHYMKRGHGLGLANCITTLMNLTLHYMTMDRIRNMYPTIDAECLCLNDDFVVGFKDDQAIDEYWDVEGEIFDELSLIRADDKSFRSYMCFVIAERYFTNLGEDKKVSYQLRELLLPLACFNIVHAKEQFISVQSVIDSDLIDNYLSELITYWGYEFYPSEGSTPYQIGGWLNLKVEKCDFSLVEIAEIELKSYHYRAFNALGVSPAIPKKGKLYESPFRKLYSFLDLDDRLKEQVNYLPYSQIAWKYGRIFSNPNKFEAYWTSLYKRRQAVFKQKSDYDYETLLVSIIHRYKSIQFYPNNDMIKTYHSSDFHKANIRDLYLDPNPINAALAMTDQMQYPFKERFSIEFAKPDSNYHIRRGLYSREIERSLKTSTLSLFFVGSSDSITWPKDGYDPSEDYLNPLAIGKLSSKIELSRGYPELLEKYRNPLIELKREIYGRFLTLEEMIFYTRTNCPREGIKDIIDNQVSLDELLELIDLHYDEIVEEELPDESLFFDDYIDERAAPKISHDPVYLQDRGFEEEYVTLDKLFMECEARFWTWRQMGSALSFDNDYTREVFFNLSAIVDYATVPGLMSRERLEIHLERQVASCPLLAYLISKTGINSLLDDNVIDPSLDDDWGTDLFGE